MDASEAATARSAASHARALLAGRGLPIDRVVDVHPDAVLWIATDGRARTTFVYARQPVANGAIYRDLKTRHGFVVEP